MIGTKSRTIYSLE